MGLFDTDFTKEQIREASVFDTPDLTDDHKVVLMELSKVQFSPLNFFNSQPITVVDIGDVTMQRRYRCLFICNKWSWSVYVRGSSDS